MKKTLQIIIISKVILYGASICSMNRLEKIMGHINPIHTSPPAQVSPISNPTLGCRPPEVQRAVDKAFEQVKKATTWGIYNGSPCYNLMGLDDDKLLKHLPLANKEQDIYIIDVGCATGKWGENAMEILLNDEACKKSGKRFHIFNLTGGKECTQNILQKAHVTLYQYNQFKIENINEELLKKGFNLENRVHLIVSHWALRHLADPFGTLKRLNNLLKPEQGMLMSNGFLFKFNDSNEVQAFPQGNANLLAHANNTTALFRVWNGTRDTDQFLLVKNSTKEFRLPLSYTAKIDNIGDRYQCDSNMATVFNKVIDADKPDLEHIKEDGRNTYYWNKNDPRAKALYIWLKQQGYIYKDLWS